MITVRSARLSDARVLSELAKQLGYPCKESYVMKGIERIAGRDDEDVLVAEIRGTVLAWTSVQVVDHFYLTPFVEISGFVVDERCRSQGVGGKLMEAAFLWVKSRGYKTLRLKANVIRKDAHRFYEKNGFERTKEQYVFVRTIE